jgi:hypothetical protein
MATKKDTTMDMPNAFGKVTKLIEQFKLPGIDTAEIVEARFRTG